MATLEHALTSLAILKVNWDRKGADYIENFVPFVAECLKLAPQAEVSLPELQSTIKDTFDLAVPQGALRTILHRAVRHGYVQQTDRIYRRNDTALATLDFAKVRNDVLRQHEALIDKLTSFCQSQHGTDWSHEEAEAAILSYLQRRSMPILAAAVEGHVYSNNCSLCQAF